MGVECSCPPDSIACLPHGLFFLQFPMFKLYLFLGESGRPSTLSAYIKYINIFGLTTNVLLLFELDLFWGTIKNGEDFSPGFVDLALSLWILTCALKNS